MLLVEAPGRGRIRYLDGLRGVSILCVLLHHACGEWHVMFPDWTNYEPFSTAVTEFPPIAYGHLAVYLFFFISGYVIYITLQRTRNVGDFLWHRWLRLFPAMLICSVIIYATAPWFSERPMGQPRLRDLIPGLTFIEPDLWAKIIPGEQRELEGAFWTLYVEVRFYILFGCAYYWLGSRNAVRLLVGLFIVGLYLRLHHSLDFLERQGFWQNISAHVDLRIGYLIDHHLWQPITDTVSYGFFASGIYFARFTRSGDKSQLAIAALLGTVNALTQGMFDPYHNREFNWPGMTMAVLLTVVIPLSCTWVRMQRFWGNPLFVFAGFISYPLYLCHQDMMVAMIVKLHAATGNLPPVLIIIPPIAAVIGLAWIIAAFGEPRLRQGIEWIAQSARVMRVLPHS